jgi:hypothetical protein
MPDRENASGTLTLNHRFSRETSWPVRPCLPPGVRRVLIGGGAREQWLVTAVRAQSACDWPAAHLMIAVSSPLPVRGLVSEQ